MNPQGILSRLVEAAFLFALAFWLVRQGIWYLEDIWEPLVIVIAVLVVAAAGWRLYKHYKDTHF